MRVIVRNGTEWFVAKDVCDLLEIQNVSQALATIPDKNQTTISLTYSGSNYKSQTLCVNEPGLYKLIFKSRKPEAEKFQEVGIELLFFLVPGLWLFGISRYSFSKTIFLMVIENPAGAVDLIV
jgi:hypothetical protein